MSININSLSEKRCDKCGLGVWLGINSIGQLDITAMCTETASRLENLKEYEDLKKQGLIIRLPCSQWLDIVFGEQEVFWGIDTDYIETRLERLPSIIVKDSHGMTVGKRLF